jgi:hypothetical protein
LTTLIDYLIKEHGTNKEEVTGQVEQATVRGGNGKRKRKTLLQTRNPTRKDDDEIQDLTTEASTSQKLARKVTDRFEPTSTSKKTRK